MLKNPVFWMNFINGVFLVFLGFCAGWVAGAVGRTKRTRALIRKWSDEELDRSQKIFAAWFKAERDKFPYTDDHAANLMALALKRDGQDDR